MNVTKGVHQFTVTALRQSASGAEFLSPTEELVDGTPATSTAIQFTGGAQDLTSYVIIQFEALVNGAQGSGYRLFGILNVTGLPAGIRLQILGSDLENFGSPTLISEARLHQLPNGSMGCWVLVPEAEASNFIFFGWRIYNNLFGEVPLAANAEFSVGEVCAYVTEEWQTNEITVELLPEIADNRSAGNQSWGPTRPMYRRAVVRIPPQSYSRAFVGDNGTEYFTGTGSLQNLAYQLSQQEWVAVVLREKRTRGSTPIDNYTLQSSTILAKFIRPGPLTSAAQNDKWPLELTFAELL